ncbi:MAG TPA: SIS domain-containing protein, partial [Gaiellaceae bacterium]
ALYAQYVLGIRHGLSVALGTPSVVSVYGAQPDLRDTLVIGISQSGASPDVVGVVAAGRSQGAPTLAITNDPTSPLAQAAEWTLCLHAGEERAVAATKTYLNSLAAVALLSAAFTRDDERVRELRAMPALVREQVESSLAQAERLDAYSDVESGSVVARGINYGTAFEIALKVRELSGIPFEPWSPPDLLHGPIAALKRGRPVIFVAPSGRALGSMVDTIAKVRERGPEAIAISDDREVLAAADTALPLVGAPPEWLSPLLTVIPGQVAAVRLATLRGIDVDRPLGLTKVTLTR